MIVSRKELKDITGELRKEGKKIVFTNGCFDIIHAGHIFYLNEAKKAGDVLVIGLNTDDSVTRLKGSSRPLNNENDRAIVLSALKMVDYVCLFSEDTPFELISLILPDILIKGGDYKKDEIVGADIVENAGGKVKIIQFVDGKSTTGIINKMKNQQ